MKIIDKCAVAALLGASSLALAACQPMEYAEGKDSAPALPSGADNFRAELEKPYRVIGTEPFWTVNIDQGVMSYRPMEGDEISVELPEPLGIDGGWVLATDRLKLTIFDRPCSDGMSDRVYPHSVQVEVDGNLLQGCGTIWEPDGAQAGLANTSWEFVTLDGKKPKLMEGMDRPGTPGISFAESSFGVGSGCNGGGGLYLAGDGWLRTGGIMATQMGCGDELMKQEEAAFGLFGGKVKWRRDGEGRLYLENGAHKAVLVEREYRQQSRDEVLPLRLEERRWNVATFNEKWDGYDGYGQSPFTASFSNGRLSIRVACNSFSGSYSVAGNRLTVGPLAATRKACPPDQQAKEDALVTLLESGPLMTVNPNRELLIASEVGEMTLQGTRTADEAEK